MPLPVGLNADTVDFFGCVTLIGFGADLELHIAGIFALGYEAAYLVSAHIEYRLKVAGNGLGVTNHARLRENRLDFIAGRKHPAPAIENHAAPGLLHLKAITLFAPQRRIIVRPDVLKIKTAPRKQTKHRDNEQED
jgi:hypothetical protein